MYVGSPPSQPFSPQISLTSRYTDLPFLFKFHRLLKFKSQLETAFNKHEKWDRIAAMMVEDGGAVYTGQALRMKYRNLVEEGLQGQDGGGVAAGTNGGRMEFGRVVGEREEGEVEESEVGSFDEWDRELMGDEDGEDGLWDGSSDEEDDTTTSKMGRGERSRKRRQRQNLSVELPRYRDGLEGEYEDEDDDDDDDDFMDGELVGGDGGGDMSE